MHKRIGMVAVLLCVGVLFFMPILTDALFTFFFIGLVPFTDYTIPPTILLIMYFVLLTFGVYGVVHQLSTAASPTKRDIESRKRARKKIIHQTSTAAKPSKNQTKKHFMPATNQVRS